MAVSGVKYSSKEVLLGIAQESTFGTNLAADTNCDGTASPDGINIAEFDEISIDDGLTQSIEQRNRANPIKYSDDAYTSQTGGVRTITISGIKMRRQDFAEFLYAVLQNVTETADADRFDKTYELWSARPDFASDEGYFCTIFVKNQIAADDEIYTSCICTELTAKADLMGDGRMIVGATFISGFIKGENQTITGTYTPSTQNYFNWCAPTTMTLTSNDLVVYSFEINIKNNGVRVGNDSTGDAQAYFVGNPMEISWTVTTKYDANTQALKTDFLAGTARELILAVGTADTAGFLQFDFDNNILTNVSRTDQDGQALEVSGEVVYDGTNMPTITLIDGKDQAW